LDVPVASLSESNPTAAAGCRYALAQLLVQHGADPNAKNNEGKMPADLVNCPEMTRAFKNLLEKGDLWR